MYLHGDIYTNAHHGMCAALIQARESQWKRMGGLLLEVEGEGGCHLREKMYMKVFGKATEIYGRFKLSRE